MSMTYPFHWSELKFIERKPQPKWILPKENWIFNFFFSKIPFQSGCGQTFRVQKPAARKVNLKCESKHRVFLRSRSPFSQFGYAPITPSLPKPRRTCTHWCLNTIYLSVSLGGRSRGLSRFLNGSFSLPSCLGQWRSHRFSFRQRKSTDPQKKRREQRPHKRLCLKPAALRFCPPLCARRSNAKVHRPTAQRKSREEQDFWKEQRKTGREGEVIKSLLGGHRQAAKWRNFPRC